MTQPEIAEHGLGLDRFAFDAGLLLLDCLMAQLEHTVGGIPARSAFYPGEEIAPMDETCAGQAAVRLYRIFPTTGRFAQQQTAPKECGTASGYAVSYEMTVYRCAAVIDSNGRAPSPAALLENVRVQLDDAAAMRRALNCCFAPALASKPYSGTTVFLEDDYYPIGPAGDGLGGRQRTTIQVYEPGCEQPPLL